MAVEALLAEPAVVAESACSALVALGTLPRVELAMSSPVSDPLTTFLLFTEFGASFPFVTASPFSCSVPTLLFASFVAAKAAPPPSTRNRQRVEMTLA